MARKTIWSIAGNLLGAACMISLLAGCGAARSSWETISPKKKVPPLEEQQPAPVQAAVGPVPVVPPPIVAPPEPAIRLRDILPDAVFVNERHDAYRQRMAQWQELAGSFAMYDYPVPDKAKWDACYELLTTVAGEYGEIIVQLGQDAPVAKDKPAAVFSALRHDIAFSEKQCEAVFSVAAAALPGQLNKFRDIVARQGEDVLRYRQQQGDPAGVISAYENLRAANPEMGVGIESRRMYGQALKSAGRLAEAADVFLDVAGELNDMEGWSLRVQAAEMLFALGEFAPARREYQHVARFFTGLKREEGDIGQRLALLDGEGVHDRELDLFRQALHGRLTLVDETPPAALLDSVRRLQEEFPASSYTEAARSLLAGVTLPESNDVQGEDVTQPTEAAEGTAVIAAPETAELEELAGKWNEAEAMVDRTQYEQAIVLFGELAADAAYQEKAGARIVEVSTQAATELRKEAAALFLKARRQTNPEVKGRLLLESRRLLRQVTEKYPRAEIIDKVKQNLSAIEEQLRQVNPALLDGESTSDGR